MVLTVQLAISFLNACLPLNDYAAGRISLFNH